MINDHFDIQCSCNSVLRLDKIGTFEEMKYKTLVIDFPWEVKNGFTDKRHYRFGEKLPYETMTDQEILNFPINDFADNNCDLFLWTTQKKTHYVLRSLKNGVLNSI